MADHQSNDVHSTPTDQTVDAIIAELLAASARFQKAVHEIPTKGNQIAAITDPADRAIIAQAAETTRILVPHRAVALMDAFLTRKRSCGMPVEQRLYATMDWRALAQRLVKCRPLVFYLASDNALTRDNVSLHGNAIWKSIQNRPPKLPLAEYLSYDEMAISALVAVSTPTLFINDGSRGNVGRKGRSGTFERFGIYVAVVGARFEVDDEMEARFMLGTIGHPPPPSDSLEPEWLTFYGADKTDRELIPLYPNPMLDATRVLDAVRYRRRMRPTFDLILAECASRSAEYRQPAYLRLLGLGLGAWAVHKAKQTALFVDEFLAAITASPCTANQLRCVDLIRIDLSLLDFALPETITTRGGAQVELRASRDNPAALLPEPYRGKCLLVATYPWDANAFPGNEYWLGALAASGDPAAACCSLIPELQNPYINSGLLDRIVVHGHDE
ncbi:hypothetical protein AMAG_13785 [Allomyces macrogynus ATCC 38327]|uniref:Uncharacterized protein n=1 Tax=Allomyces macrogynus (strain ATCC 38327) TaxID=578462 RepID=A0A0L0T3Y7_ALLM3|nr:hypothetical protein AMAG_13785 [Allomyces macrogynus ATCC 38327]|eukprot:KNE69425.1 hypothetical protein AMAG_13785 [Allomyces macrogynus ATCC 38327]